MKNKILLTLASISFAGIALAGPQAPDNQPPQERKHPMMRMLDTNNDNKITKQEALQSSEDRFNKIDLNKDGVITEDELNAAMKSHRGGPKGEHKGEKDKHDKEGKQAPQGQPVPPAPPAPVNK